MKKIIFATAVAAICATALTSCNNSPKDVKDSTSEAAASELKIAYIENDSIESQYQFAKDVKALLEKKDSQASSTLAAKQRELESAAAKFQQDINANALTREQAESRNAALQQQGNNFQALQQRLMTELQNETLQYTQALQDSIQNYINAYNKDKKYSFILIKGAGSNILYADPAYDITAEVIAGLNKAYKPTEELKGAKAE